MLVLTRKPGDKVVIGDNIEITVLEIKGNTIRLGIAAPREVSVLRGELAHAEVAGAAANPARLRPPAPRPEAEGRRLPPAACVRGPQCL